MVNYNHKQSERMQSKNNEERNNIDVEIGSQNRAFHSGIEDSLCVPTNMYASHEGNVTHKVCNSCNIDLGMYYIERAIDAMEQWHSRPREGYHVTDVVMCPRQKVFREIDRRPIDAKTVSIYAVGKATHEAYQSLYRSDRRTFEIEKYVEIEDVGLYIQGSVDIYDRKRNIPLEFKTTRSSDIKEPKKFHVEGS